MPKKNGTLSRNKSKEEIEKQTFVNFTELQIYFDGMTAYRIKDLIALDPFFPDKATRTQWTLESIKRWERRSSRVAFWEDRETVSTPGQRRFEEKLAVG